MHKQSLGLKIISLTLLLLGLLTTSVAALSSSPNYEVNEEFFGSGGSLNSCSASYCSKQALGELTVGNTKSTHYQANNGFNTSDIPLLSLVVNGGNFDLGTLSTAATASTSTTFNVEDYLSNGYVVQVVGPGLTNYGSTHTFNTYNTPTQPTTGVEQFGINLAANTSPAIGAAPQQIPNSTFSFGKVAHNYNEGGARTSISYDTPNYFLYNSGDTIAYSTTSSGETIYTLSVIADQSTTTPSAAYNATLNLIVIPTF